MGARGFDSSAAVYIQYINYRRLQTLMDATAKKKKIFIISLFAAVVVVIATSAFAAAVVVIWIGQ